MRGITVGEMVEILGWLHKPLMVSGRKIEEWIEEKIAVKIDGLIGEKTDKLIDKWIEEKIGNSIGVKIGEKIARWIAARIIGQMRVVNSVGLIEPIRWPANMGVKDERMPA
jgi:hypothetical protein